MGFTNPEKIKIYKWMGFPHKNFATQTLLEFAIQALELDADVVTEIQGILTEIDNITTQLVDARKRYKADAVGDVKLNGVRELKLLRKEAKRLVNEMAGLLGVEPQRDAFADTSHFKRGYRIA